MVSLEFSNLPSDATPLHQRYRFVRHGFNALAIYWILRFFLRPDGINIENILTSLFLVLSFVFFWRQISLELRRTASRLPFDSVSRLFVHFLFFMCAVTFIRGITPDLSRLLTLFVNPVVGGTVWLLPFAILIGAQRDVFQSLMPSFRHHAIAGFVFAFIALVLFSLDVSYDVAMASTKSAQILLYPASFVLLAGLGNRKYRRLFVLSIVAMMVLHLVLGNRLNFVISLLVLTFAFTVGSVRSGSRIFFRLIATACVAFSLGIIGFDYMASITPESWLIDSRSFLVEELMLDFSFVDMILGRGALGGYYSDYFNVLLASGIEGGDSPHRQVVESGYLHILLKAGVLGIVATVAVILRAVIFAKKFRDARLGVGVMAFLTLQLLVMTVGLNLSFDPFHVLTWMIIGLSLAQTRYQFNLGGK